MQRQLDRAGFLMTIGGAILAVVALQDWIGRIWSVPLAYRWAAIVGFAILGLALVLIVLWWFRAGARYHHRFWRGSVLH